MVLCYISLNDKGVQWEVKASAWDRRHLGPCAPAKALPSCPALCNFMNCSRQAPLSMGLSREEYWSGLPLSSPGDLSNPGIESMSRRSPALAGGFSTTSATWEAHLGPHLSPVLHMPTFLSPPEEMKGLG